MAAVTICSDFETQENKVCHCLHCFPMIFIFWMLSFKPAFSLCSFAFLKRPFSFSLLSSVRMVSSAYLRLLIFLLAILIPACASSSSAFHMMYSAYKLNKLGNNIQLWCTPFLIWNQSLVPYLVQTVASWPPCRFLRRQVRWSSIPVSNNLGRYYLCYSSIAAKQMITYLVP